MAFLKVILNTQMNLTHRYQANNVLVLEPRAIKLTGRNTQVLLKALTQFIAQGQNVVLDLAGVQFIDSLGLGALLACLRIVEVFNGQLHLCELSQTVEQLFKLMRLNNSIKIYGTCANAVQGFAVLTLAT